MEFLKDTFAAMNDRVRSPFFGSILIVFIGANWRPVAYLLFGEQSLLDRFEYFEANSSVLSLLVAPLLIGVVLAILFPWIKLAGAFFASAPKRRLDSLENEEAMLRRIGLTRMEAKEQRALADLEEAEEQRKIAAAKRLEQAKEVSEETGRELERDRVEKTSDAGKPITNKKLSSDIRATILIGMSLADDGKGILRYSRSNNREPVPDEFVFFGLIEDSWIKFKNDRRKRLLVEATIEDLVKGGYVEILTDSLHDAPVMQLTLKGYEAADYLKSQFSPQELAAEYSDD